MYLYTLALITFWGNDGGCKSNWAFEGAPVCGYSFGYR